MDEFVVSYFRNRELQGAAVVGGGGEEDDDEDDEEERIKRQPTSFAVEGRLLRLSFSVERDTRSW